MDEEDCQKSNKEKIQELIDQVDAIKSVYNDESVVEKFEKIGEIVEKAEQISLHQGNEKNFPERTNETVMEVELMKNTHVVVEQIMGDVFKTGLSTDECINMFKSVITQADTLNWSKLTQYSMQCIKFCRFQSAISTNKGDEETITLKKVRQVGKRTLSKRELKPEKIGKIQKQDKGAEKLNKIMQLIKAEYAKNNKPLYYYKVIIDPNNYAQTVENGLQISFLVRDGSIYLGANEEGHPVVRPLTAQEKRELSKSTTTTINTFNGDFIDEQIKKLRITEPFLNINVYEDNDCTSSGSESEDGQIPSTSTNIHKRTRTLSDSD